MPEIVTIGESMVSFVPEREGFLRYAERYERKVVGAESNLAIYASRFGHSSGWVSCLGEDEFGYLIRNAIRAEGVDVSRVKFVKDRYSGVMFKQILPGRETAVFYYRDSSAASGMNENDVPEDYIREAKILHLTGITPTLGPGCIKMVERALQVAKECGSMVSFDPNIRKKLWGKTDYSKILVKLCLEADIVLLGQEEAKILFGIADAEQICRYLIKNGNAVYVAVKNGADNTIVAERDKIEVIAPYACHCVDPVGAGDAFNAAFLCGVLEKRSLAECGRMGAAAGAMATEGNGDTDGCPSREYLDRIIYGGKENLR